MSELSNAAVLKSWRTALDNIRNEPEHSRLIGGSFTMLVGSGLVNGFNFAYNVAIGRMLGPIGLGNALAAVTLLMLLSSVTLSYQLVCAKFVARNETPGARSAVYRTLMFKAWMVGIGIGATLAALSGPIARYLNLPGPGLVVLLSVGIAFYPALGAKRGALQGVCAFRRLSANMVLETSTKLVGAIVLIALGFGVYGAVIAISISVIVSYLLPPVTRELRHKPEPGIPASFREGMQAIIFFSSQVVITNIDILLVKHFFESHQAGLYAAVALVGRVVYQLSWSVISAMLPISAGSKKSATESVLVVPLVLVLVIALTFTFGLALFPQWTLHTLFGEGFADMEVASLLTIFAASTGVYSLSVVLTTYEMSRKLSSAVWVQFAFSIAVAARVYLFHHTLRQVVIVQLVLMVGLLIASALPFFRRRPKRDMPLETELERSPAVPDLIAPVHAVRRVRRVPEAEVIAAFLKNEFYHREFDKDRERFRDVVMHPDTTNDLDNALRRALLNRRRDGMWREFPADLQWWELELSRADLDRIRVFPRAEWRNVSHGSFLLKDVAANMSANLYTGKTRAFVQKVNALSSHLRLHDHDSMIMLIATNERAPMTLIEGNHRMTAAMMAGPEVLLTNFRVVCGFSPNVARVCWYHGTVRNLAGYALRRLRSLVHDHDRDIERIMVARNMLNAKPAITTLGEDPVQQRAA